MDLSILLVSVAGLVGSVVLLFVGVRWVRADRTHSHLPKPPPPPKPVAVVKVEEKTKPLTILEIAKKHQEWSKGES